MASLDELPRNLVDILRYKLPVEYPRILDAEEQRILDRNCRLASPGLRNTRRAWRKARAEGREMQLRGVRGRIEGRPGRRYEDRQDIKPSDLPFIYQERHQGAALRARRHYPVRKEEIAERVGYEGGAACLGAVQDMGMGADDQGCAGIGEAIESCARPLVGPIGKLDAAVDEGDDHRTLARFGLYNRHAAVDVRGYPRRVIGGGCFRRREPELLLRECAEADEFDASRIRAGGFLCLRGFLSRRTGAYVRQAGAIQIIDRVEQALRPEVHAVIVAQEHEVEAHLPVRGGAARREAEAVVLSRIRRAPRSYLPFEVPDENIARPHGGYQPGIQELGEAALSFQ